MWAPLTCCGESKFILQHNEIQNLFDIKIKYIFIDFHNVLQQKARSEESLGQLQLLQLEKYISQYC